MPEPVLQVLKILLLLLLYLFFARVLHAVWAELRSPAEPVAAGGGTARRGRGRAGAGATARPAGPAPVRSMTPSAPRTARALIILEPAANAGREIAIPDGEATVGRAPGCGVQIDDATVSSTHARLFRRDGSVFVEDLGSTNGTFVNRNRTSGPVRLDPGDRLTVGSHVLEVLA